MDFDSKIKFSIKSFFLKRGFFEECFTFYSFLFFVFFNVFFPKVYIFFWRGSRFGLLFFLQRGLVCFNVKGVLFFFVIKMFFFSKRLFFFFRNGWWFDFFNWVSVFHFHRGLSYSFVNGVCFRFQRFFFKGSV